MRGAGDGVNHAVPVKGKDERGARHQWEAGRPVAAEKTMALPVRGM